MQRDGDARVFEKVLLHFHEDEQGHKPSLRLKDIAPHGKVGYDEDSLLKYGFNLQRHMVEKVSVELENCMLVSHNVHTMEGAERNQSPTGRNSDDKQVEWFVSYKKKSEFFKVLSPLSFYEAQGAEKL